MKKLLVIFLSLILTAFVTASPKNKVLAKDSQTLVIYSWEDYLDLGYEEEDLGEPLGNEEREFLTAYVRGLSAEQYNNFFIWLEKQFGTRKIAELTNVQGKKAVAILKNRRK